MFGGVFLGTVVLGAVSVGLGGLGWATPANLHGLLAFDCGLGSVVFFFAWSVAWFSCRTESTGCWVGPCPDCDHLHTVWPWFW